MILWSENWQLYFNTGKCKRMHIGTSNDKNEYTMKIGDEDTTIEECTEEKDLGVIFDTSLKFDIHINNVVNKANKILGVTRRTFEYMDPEIFGLIFKGLVRPHLEYAAPVWSPHLVKHKDLLENVQRRATKMVLGLSQLSYSERLKKLNFQHWPTAGQEET